METKPAPTPAWRADPTALLIDPLDPDFAEPRPPPKDTSPQLSADELRRAGIGTLSTSATSALSALALAGERASDAAKGFRTAFANSKLASTKLARSADDDDDDDDDAVDADGFTSKTLQNERTLHACFNEAMRARLEGASAKAVSHRSMRTAVARWSVRTTPHHACFDAWATFATAAGHVRRREESARRCEATLMKPPSGRTDEETESVYELVRGSCSLFEGCPRYEIVELCRRVRLERFVQGDVLLSPGDFDDKVFIPVTGSVSQWMEPEREKEGEETVGADGRVEKHAVASRTYVPGRSFGNPAIANAPQHASTFVADADTWCVTLSTSDCGGTTWEPAHVTVRKRIDFLCRVPGLFDATLTELNALASCAEERRYEPGVALTNQGQECRGVYFILSGTVALIRRVLIDGTEGTDKETHDEPVPETLRSALPDAAAANDRRRMVHARAGAVLTPQGVNQEVNPQTVDVQVRTVGSFGVVGAGDYFNKPAPCACFAVPVGAKPVTALFVVSKHFVKLLSPKALERFARGCHPTSGDDDLRNSLAAKESAEARTRALWEEDDMAVEGMEPIDADEELKRNALAYSDSDSEGDGVERRLDRPTLVPSARRSLRPFLRPRGARDGDARHEARRGGFDVVGWPFLRGVYDPKTDFYRAGQTGGGHSPCAKKPSTAIDTNAAKLAAIRDVGLIAAKSRVQQVPRNPAERKGSYYLKFLDELAGFDVDAVFAFDPTTASPEWKSHDDWTDFTTRPRMLSKLEMQNAKVVQARRVIDARVERTRDDANRRGGVHKIGIHKIKEPAAVLHDTDGTHEMNAETMNAAKRWLGYREDARPDGSFVFKPNRRTAVLDEYGRVTAFRVASETALRRQQRRLDGYDRGFEFGYDIGKMHDADEACSTARSAGGVGACVDDWREGKGDAGGDLGSDGAAAPDHSSDLCVAVCRLADATRTCMSTRDDLCAMASKMCVESGVLSCVRWSGDSFLVLGDCVDPYVDDAEEIEYISRHVLNVALTLCAFLRDYHVGKVKAQASTPPPGGWIDGTSETMEPQGRLSVGVSVGSAFMVNRAGALHALDGTVRDDAARLCDLATGSTGGVRCDAKVHPLCKDTHTLVPMGGGEAALNFAGYEAVGDPFRGLGPLRAGETAPRRHTARVPASVPYFKQRDGGSRDGGTPKSRARKGVGGAAGKVLSEFLG